MSNEMSKSEKVTLISTIVLIGFFCAVVYHYVLGAYLGATYPANTFLGSPTEAFGDFIGIVSISKSWAPYSQANAWINYFPLAYILYFPFAVINNNILSYGVFVAAFLSFLVYGNIKYLKCADLTRIQNLSNIFIITLLSYPVLLLLDRGNLDQILFIVFALFVYFFKKEKYMLSMLCLTFLNLIKPFFILFLFLFLFKRKNKEFFYSVILTALSIIVGFMVLKGNFFAQVAVYINNMMTFKNVYIYINEPAHNFGMIQNSSLFMALKLIFCRLTVPSITQTVVLEKIYNLVWFFSNLIILFFVAKEKIFWRKIALLTFSMLVFPYVINDYKLIFILVPLWLFVTSKESSRFDIFYTVLFALLLIPKGFIISNFPMENCLFSVSILLNPIIILCFIILIFWENIKEGKISKENL